MTVFDREKHPTALIPIVTRGGGEVDWLDVYCRPATAQEKEKARQINQEVAIVPLAKKQMLKTALAGLEAVNRLLGRRGMRVWQLNTRLGEVSVDTDRLLPNAVEDRSSDLGIGLALLLGLMASGRPIVALAATGQLGAFKKQALNDLPVEPVGALEEKLEALLAEKQRGGGAVDAVTYVFTPRETATGVKVVELDVAQRLQRMPGIKLYPVGSFGEAAAILGIKPRPPWRLFALAGSALLAVALSVSAARFLARPATLEWLPAEAGWAAEPYVVCLDAQRLPVKPHPVGAAGSLPRVPAQGELAWKVKAGQQQEAEHWLYRALQTFGYDTRYHLAMVLIGQSTGVRARTVNLPAHSERETVPARVNPGGVWRHRADLDGTAEPSLLVLLANRFQGFDPEALQQALQAELASERHRGPAGIDLEAAKHFLEKQADVSLSFPFQADGEDPVCVRP